MSMLPGIFLSLKLAQMQQKQSLNTEITGDFLNQRLIQGRRFPAHLISCKDLQSRCLNLHGTLYSLRKPPPEIEV